MQGNYKDSYVRCRIVSLNADKEFICVYATKARTNLEVYGFLKRLEKFTAHIHKIRVRKHDETLRIIGIEVQVKDSFPVIAHANHEYRVMYPLELGHALDSLTVGKDRTYLNEIRGHLLFNHELMSHPVHQQVSTQDLYREELRRLDTNQIFKRSMHFKETESYNQGRSKHISQVKVRHAKSNKRKPL